MSETASKRDKPAVTLFKSPSCPHCPTILKFFHQLQQAGQLASLHVYDVTQHSELAAQYGVRSVPWFKIDKLEFQGLHSAAELEYWISHAQTAAGIKRYLIEQLETGQLQQVTRLLQSVPAWLSIAVQIMADMDSPMQARIGIGAVLEGLAGTQQLRELIPELGRLTRHAAHSVRIDACHYLGLSSDPAARPYLESCLQDTDATVREVAEEALTQIDK